MNARHVARELAVLTLSQERISKKDYDEIKIEDLIEQAVRILISEVSEILSNAKGDLIKADDQLLEASLRGNPETIKELLSDSMHATQRAMELVFYCNEWPLIATLAMRDEVKKFAVDLVKLIKEHKKEIEDIIEKSIVDWTLESMYSIDRNIILLTVAEIVYEKTSPKIAIDEAIEIAKKYGSEDSGSFVNGVMNRILKTLGIETKSE